MSENFLDNEAELEFTELDIDYLDVNFLEDLLSVLDALAFAQEEDQLNQIATSVNIMGTEIGQDKKTQITTMKALLKNLVGSVAPTLGTALGGPMGGMAANMIADVLGCKNEPKEIQKAIDNATPEQMLELKKAEAEFELKMKELEVDVFKLEVQDTQNARSTFSKDWTARIIGIAVIGGFMGYIFLVTIQPPEQNSEALINLVLGYLGGLASAIISFYFGASNTSKDD